jgi:hypothetical protein
MVQKTGREIDSCAAKKCTKKLVSSKFAKTLNKKVATKIRETYKKT